MQKLFEMEDREVSEPGFGLRVEFKVQDLWIGLFWQTKPVDGVHRYRTDWWLCLLPCIPIHFWRVYVV